MVAPVFDTPPVLPDAYDGERWEFPLNPITSWIDPGNSNSFNENNTVTDVTISGADGAAAIAAGFEYNNANGIIANPVVAANDATLTIDITITAQSGEQATASGLTLELKVGSRPVLPSNADPSWGRALARSVWDGFWPANQRYHGLHTESDFTFGTGGRVLDSEAGLASDIRFGGGTTSRNVSQFSLVGENNGLIRYKDGYLNQIHPNTGTDQVFDITNSSLFTGSDYHVFHWSAFRANSADLSGVPWRVQRTRPDNNDQVIQLHARLDTTTNYFTYGQITLLDGAERGDIQWCIRADGELVVNINLPASYVGSSGVVNATDDFSQNVAFVVSDGVSQYADSNNSGVSFTPNNDPFWLTAVFEPTQDSGNWVIAIYTSWNKSTPLRILLPAGTSISGMNVANMNFLNARMYSMGRRRFSNSSLMVADIGVLGDSQLTESKRIPSFILEEGAKMSRNIINANPRLGGSVIGWGVTSVGTELGDSDDLLDVVQVDDTNTVTGRFISIFQPPNNHVFAVISDDVPGIDSSDAANSVWPDDLSLELSGVTFNSENMSGITPAAHLPPGFPSGVRFRTTVPATFDLLDDTAPSSPLIIVSGSVAAAATGISGLINDLVQR